MTKVGKRLVFFYIIVGLAVFLYSFTQIDLGMTLTEMSIWRAIQTSFQYIGYFLRPLSTGIYCTLIAILFILSGITLYEAAKKTLTKRDMWSIAGVIAATVGLSYPAFSYDLFNYMFSAKTIILYGKNPYTVIPLQFTGFEPWLSFMHWTHAPSIYPPFWIALTIIPFVLGFDIFLLTLWNFKVLMILSYLVSVWAIAKTLDHEKHNSVLGMAIYATSPIVIIEGLVSGHNDIVMMVFALLSIVAFSQRKRITSWLLLFFSIGIKIMTLFLIPSLFFKSRRWPMLGLMILALLAIFTQREFYPWYFLWIIPFVALLPEVRFLTILAFGFSLGLLSRYVPFLYFGLWDSFAISFRWWGMGISVGLSLIVALIVDWKILGTTFKKNKHVLKIPNSKY